MTRRQPLVARDLVHRSWWWVPGGRNKKKAKRRSARRERAAVRSEIRGVSSGE